MLIFALRTQWKNKQQINKMGKYREWEKKLNKIFQILTNKDNSSIRFFYFQRYIFRRSVSPALYIGSDN